MHLRRQFAAEVHLIRTMFTYSGFTSLSLSVRTDDVVRAFGDTEVILDNVVDFVKEAGDAWNLNQ